GPRQVGRRKPENGMKNGAPQRIAPPLVDASATAVVASLDLARSRRERGDPRTVLRTGGRPRSMLAMDPLGVDFTGWLGFPVRVALLSLAARLMVAVAVALTLGAALRAVLLLRARRFLEQTHWSERARTLWPLRGLMTLSLAIIGVL